MIAQKCLTTARVCALQHFLNMERHKGAGAAGMCEAVQCNDSQYLEAPPNSRPCICDMALPIGLAVASDGHGC